MRSQRWAWTHTYAVPLFVASLVAVLLAGSGLVAVVVFDRARTPGGGGDPRPGGVDCQVGTWELTGYTENKDGLGTARMLGGSPVFTFGSDGSGVADYRGGATLQVEVFGTVAEVEVTGEITYRYRISGQTLEFVTQDSSATMSSDIDVLGIGANQRFTLPTGPIDYRCDGDSMDLTHPESTFAYRRSG